MQGGGMAQALQTGCGKAHGHPSPWGTLGVLWGCAMKDGGSQVQGKLYRLPQRAAVPWSEELGGEGLEVHADASPAGHRPGEEQRSGPPRPSPLHRHPSTWEHRLQVPAELRGEDSHETALKGSPTPAPHLGRA